MSSSLIHVELACIYYLKLGRAMDTGNLDAMVKMDSMLRGHLRDLNTMKTSRTKESYRPPTTPAEWATALLEKMKETEKKDEPAVEPEKPG